MGHSQSKGDTIPELRLYMQKTEDKELWRFDGNVCDHGTCVGDCDKCNRNLPFGEEVEDEET